MKKILLSFVLLLVFNIGTAQGPPGIITYNYYNCENDTDGFATFDLTSRIPIILSTLDPNLYAVEFSYEDVVITDLLTAYENTVPYTQQLWARVYNIETNATYNLRSGYLKLQVTNIPIANLAPNLSVYPDEVVEALQQQITIIVGSQQNMVVTFYNSQADAEGSQNAINTSCNYTISSNTVWARITAAPSPCYAVTSFSMEILDGTNPNPSETIVFADNNFKGRLLQSDTTQEIAYNACNELIKIDQNNDGEIQQNEADLVVRLNVSNASVTSVEGIQFFKNLKEFNCSENQLTELNVSGLNKLSSVNCADNQLQELDFSQNPKLSQFSCSNNNLTFVNVKNGCIQNPQSPSYFSNNPELTYICADSAEVNFIAYFLNLSQITGAQINTYCSTVPGGPYNIITGKILLDQDGDGCDSDDLPLDLTKINIAIGNSGGSTFVDSQGNYTFYTQSGTHVLEPVIENASYFQITPATVSVAFADNNNNTSVNDFCVTYSGTNPDAEIVIVPAGGARPGFDAAYTIIYKNKGGLGFSGSINLMFPDEVLDFVSASVIPSLQTEGNLNWSFTNMLPFETRIINLIFNVNSPAEVPPVNINDILNFTASVTISATDVNPDDNISDLIQTVVGSYDPNNKVCTQGDFAAPTQIGKYLDYVINFENTGNTAASFVVVKDIVDTAQFDMASFQLLNASHPMSIRITGNTVEFFFSGIDLEPEAHGYVAFKIKTKNTLVTGNSVSNKADIYFDYNFPVTTNVAMTTFDTLGTDNPFLDNEISIYPNPTNGIVSIKANSEVKSIELFDIQGRRLLVKNNVEILDISGYNSGVYFIKINTDRGIKTQKLIKQ